MIPTDNNKKRTRKDTTSSESSTTSSNESEKTFKKSKNTAVNIAITLSIRRILRNEGQWTIHLPQQTTVMTMTAELNFHKDPSFYTDTIHQATAILLTGKPCKGYTQTNHSVKFESAEYAYQTDTSKFNKVPMPINEHFRKNCMDPHYMETEGQKPITQMTLSFDCRVVKRPTPPPNKIDKLKEEAKEKFTETQEEALKNLHEIATNFHIRPIHTTTNKLGTMLFAYMQHTGISQQNEEKSNACKPKKEMVE